ncbi:hypothetical protein Tco_1551951, partial [Tanacetum coccineum]
FTLSKALAKKQAPFGDSNDMSRTYTSFLLGKVKKDKKKQNQSKTDKKRRRQDKSEE